MKLPSGENRAWLSLNSVCRYGFGPRSLELVAASGNTHKSCEASRFAGLPLTLTEYNKNRPSRDQSWADLSSFDLNSNCSSPAPVEGFSYKLKTAPPRSDEKMMRVPSGDHTGNQSMAGWDVSRVLVRSNWCTQMSYGVKLDALAT